MIKLKDLVWSDVDLGDESLLSADNNFDTEGHGEVVIMCCGGGGGGADVPSIQIACPRCPYITYY